MLRRSNRRGQNRNRLHKDKNSVTLHVIIKYVHRVDLTVVTEEIHKCQPREQMDRQRRSNEYHREVFPYHCEAENPDWQSLWDALGVQDYTPSY